MKSTFFSQKQHCRLAQTQLKGLGTCSSRFLGMFESLPSDWRTATGVRASVGRRQITSSSCVDGDLRFLASGFTCLCRETW